MKKELYSPINGGRKKPKYLIHWFLDSILSCGGCFGFWAAGIVFALLHFHIDMLLYGFAGSAIGIVMIDLINFLERK